MADEWKLGSETGRVDEKEWAIPPAPGINLDRGELLLVDWVLCSASRLIPNADLDHLLNSWHDMRLAVWKSVAQLDTPTSSEAKFRLSDTEAKALLAVVPTTFRWGTGPDSGYSLKQKLARFLSSGEYDEYINANKGAV